MSDDYDKQLAHQDRQNRLTASCVMTCAFLLFFLLGFWPTLMYQNANRYYEAQVEIERIKANVELRAIDAKVAEQREATR